MNVNNWRGGYLLNSRNDSSLDLPYPIPYSVYYEENYILYKLYYVLVSRHGSSTVNNIAAILVSASYLEQRHYLIRDNLCS